MMSMLANWYPGHRVVEFFIIVAGAVTVITAAACVVSLFQERNAANRHGVLLSALAASLASPILAFAFMVSGRSVINIPLFLAQETSVSPRALAHETMPSPSLPETADQLPESRLSGRLAGPSAPEQSFTAQVIATESKSLALDSAISPADPFRSAAVAVLAIWFCGIMAVVSGLFRSAKFLLRLRRSIQPISNANLRRALTEAERLAGARTSPAIGVSSLARTPLATGIIRPVIILPLNLPGAISDSQLRDILTHEIAHLERRDQLVVMLQVLGKAIFWPIPFMHLLNRSLARAREEICDNFVLAHRDAVSYGETLLSIATLACGKATPLGTVGILHWRGKLEDRIFGLIHQERRKLTRMHPIIALTVFVSFLSASAMLSSMTLVAAQSDPSSGTNDRKPVAGETAQKRSPTNRTEQAARVQFTEPAETLHYTGRVVDRVNGKPISDAIVTVRRSLRGDPALKQETVEQEKVIEETKHTTDADGKYSFDIPPEQSSTRYLFIAIDVEHADYVSPTLGYGLSLIRKNEKLGDRPFFERLELSPGKQEPVTGVVETPAGIPAAGVRIQAYSLGVREGEDVFAAQVKETTTDSNGRFQVNMTTPGDAILWVFPKEHAPLTRKLKLDQRGELGTLRLRDGLNLRGRVVDAKGQPLAEVSVNARRQNAPDDERVRNTDEIGRAALTNDQGEFAMDPLLPGEYVLVPEEHHRDTTEPGGVRSYHPLPAVFLAQRIVLKDGQEPRPMEIRAVPHVAIEAQQYNSQAKPTRGCTFLVAGRIDGTSRTVQGRQDAQGKLTALLPHGFEVTQFAIVTDAHGVVRCRRTKDDPLGNRNTFELGTLNDDVRGIEIVRYAAPILLINTVDDENRPIQGLRPEIRYASEASPRKPGGSFVNGLQGDVYIWKQDDGRWRSEGLLPDEEITLTVGADGFSSQSLKLKLAEGESKEIQLKLAKATDQGYQ